LASIKKLAGQTIWYGLSNIAAKLINQLQTPIVTRLLHTSRQVSEYGDFSVLYACISFVNVVYTYGLETAYFRFSASGEDQKKLFQTLFTSILLSTAILSPLIIFFREPISRFTGLNGHPEYITWCVILIAIDTVAAIPFARLRQEGRPKKYAFIRVMGIILNFALMIYFLAYSPDYVKNYPYSAYAAWYGRYDAAGFMILANIAGSALTLLLLAGEWLQYRFRFDVALWKKVIYYCYPMVIVGLGGMVNETIDRIMLRKLLPVDDQTAKMAVAIYSANYKLAIFITLFIQAFRMSAEPFFFSQSQDKNAPKTYARVMKWFVITLCSAFLFTALFIDMWNTIFLGKAYHGGLGVVPILLGANVCLGIYYNLSVWYKVTDKMHYGMYITLVGAVLTLIINFSCIPKYGMYACAWATLAAYGSMMVISYISGQKYFPVPYNLKKLLAYLTIMLLLYGAEELVRYLTGNFIVRTGTALVLMSLFVRLIMTAERKELVNIPVIGKYIRV